MCRTRSRRPPTSTLCPYTTLFRSRRHRRMLEEDLLQHRVLADPPGRRLVRHLRLHERRHDIAGVDRVARDALDRKSTRLNSSHVAISYAVFCLKKNNIQEHTETDY